MCDLKQTSSVDIKMACEDENGKPIGDSDGDCGYWMYGMIRTEQQSGLQASRRGDSGAPVYTLMPNINQVRAKGILSAGDHNREMYFQDWDTIDTLFYIYPRYCWDYGCL